MALDSRWATVAGLFMDFIGAAVLLSAAFVSKRKAAELAVPRVASDDPDVNATLPQAQDRLLQSRRAKWGLALLALGFGLQILGAWPRG